MGHQHGDGCDSAGKLHRGLTSLNTCTCTPISRDGPRRGVSSPPAPPRASGAVPASAARPRTSTPSLIHSCSDLRPPGPSGIKLCRVIRWTGTAHCSEQPQSVSSLPCAPCLELCTIDVARVVLVELVEDSVHSGGALPARQHARWTAAAWRLQEGRSAPRKGLGSGTRGSMGCMGCALHEGGGPEIMMQPRERL